MWVRFTILWADLVRHSPGSDRSSLEWGGLAGSGELDRLPTIDHRREAIDRRCRLNVIFGNGLRKLGVEKKIIPGGAGTFYSGQEKRDRCNVSEAGSQRGRKSFVATPEQRNNVKILVGLTLCLARRLTLASGSQTRNHTAAAAKATNAMRAATFYAVARDTLLSRGGPSRTRLAAQSSDRIA
jgi:hypothetical protein